MHTITNHHRARRGSDRQGGFTLIELLVVIAILGILAAIVVFSVGGITDRGNLSACDSTKKTVITASEAFKAQTGNYAATLQELGEFVKDVPDSGNVINMKDGKTVTYAGTSGEVTDTCGP